jgi:hypothetical protein
MKLIKEYVDNVKYLTEADEKTGKKGYFIEGVFMQANRPNKNLREYSMDILGNEVNRYVKEYVEQNRAYGELGHPDTPTINLERVSHMIKSLKVEGDNFIGKAKIMDTPYGNIVKNLIDEGARIGVSSRGLGSLRKRNDGINIVQDDFRLATAADIVADPSAPDAFVHGIREGKEWVFVEGRFEEVDIDRAKTAIQKASRKDIETVAAQLFENFLRKL